MNNKSIFEIKPPMRSTNIQGAVIDWVATHNEGVSPKTIKSLFKLIENAIQASTPGAGDGLSASMPEKDTIEVTIYGECALSICELPVLNVVEIGDSGITLKAP